MYSVVQHAVRKAGLPDWANTRATQAFGAPPGGTATSGRPHTLQVCGCGPGSPLRLPLPCPPVCVFEGVGRLLKIGLARADAADEHREAVAAQTILQQPRQLRVSVRDVRPPRRAAAAARGERAAAAAGAAAVAAGVRGVVGAGAAASDGLAQGDDDVSQGQQAAVDVGRLLERLCPSVSQGAAFVEPRQARRSAAGRGHRADRKWPAAAPCVQHTQCPRLRLGDARPRRATQSSGPAQRPPPRALHTCPVTPLRLTRSLPAKSTRWNFDSKDVVRTCVGDWTGHKQHV
jgi:hypothetical protein